MQSGGVCMMSAVKKGSTIERKGKEGRFCAVGTDKLAPDIILCI